jgi:hypothetical protein
VAVGAGEIILLPRNEPHQLGSGPNIRPVSVDHLVQPGGDGRPPRIVYGGGGERTRMLCGFLGSDSRNPPIASILPASLTLAVTETAASAWIESSFRFAAQELGSGSGSPTLLARIAELLFIEAAAGMSSRCRRRNMDGSRDCGIQSSAGRSRSFTDRARTAGRPTSWRGRRAHRVPHSSNDSAR